MKKIHPMYCAGRHRMKGDDLLKRRKISRMEAFRFGKWNELIRRTDKSEKLYFCAFLFTEFLSRG